MIRRALCLVLLLSVAASVTAATPKRIGNASSLRIALANGASVSVVIDYGRCELVSAGDAQFTPPMAGGLVVENWHERVGGERGNESLTVTLTGDELVAHPRHGMMRRHLEIAVSLEDRVDITLRHLDLDTHDVVSTWRLTTTFDHGDTGAAAFYRLD